MEQELERLDLKLENVEEETSFPLPPPPPPPPPVPQERTVVIEQQGGTNIVIRFLWMLFIGWWLSGIFYMVGAILTLLIITSPLGMVVMQKLGWAFSLYEEDSGSTVIHAGDTTIVTQKKNTNFVVRYLYFMFIGWWVGLIAMSIAWILGIIIIGLPLSIMIMNRMGKIMTLAA
ncbi:MAG: YccF domain-containing protein [Arenicellales bacterium]|jgi:uncharacterized membrane protein YccF (DUF307 family)|nr:YccF domain-containing protein [Arenicellales bacterium]